MPESARIRYFFTRPVSGSVRGSSKRNCHSMLPSLVLHPNRMPRGRTMSSRSRKYSGRSDCVSTERMSGVAFRYASEIPEPARYSKWSGSRG
ncbi:Uncharacterised protein [Mycobacteroides abscessus subsp. abscessus]|nr:Uncharacterised protein [Mycobacteroides abscessus subsp. abscessus]